MRTISLPGFRFRPKTVTALPSLSFPPGERWRPPPEAPADADSSAPTRRPMNRNPTDHRRRGYATLADPEPVHDGPLHLPTLEYFVNGYPKTISETAYRGRCFYLHNLWLVLPTRPSKRPPCFESPLGIASRPAQQADSIVEEIASKGTGPEEPVQRIELSGA